MKQKINIKKHLRTLYSLSFLILLTFLLVQCKNLRSKDVNKYIETNIEYCMSPLINKGVDSLQARDICKCCMEVMFKIEPNILKLSSENWNRIFESNKDKIIDECPQLGEIVKKEDKAKL